MNPQRFLVVDKGKVVCPQKRLSLSGVVIAFNEADRIVRCIESLSMLCDEVLVVDSGSTDGTVEVARAAGANVVNQPWLGFAAQKNVAIGLARNPWVLLLDADEWLGDGAAASVTDLFASDRVNHADVWCLERRTHYLGKAIRYGGWGRALVQRLFRNRLRYLPALVHERLDVLGERTAKLSARIEHDTARSESEYRQKLTHYAELFARQRFAEGRRASLASPIGHAVFHAMKNGILRGGFLDGPLGWRYHMAHIRYVWNKYERLRALTAAGGCDASRDQ